MNKKIIMKGILLLIVLAVLSLGFGGCGALIIIPTTGTVVITIVGYYTYYNYNVYLDSWYNQIGITSGGTFTATGITPGSHTFYVDHEVGGDGVLREPGDGALHEADPSAVSLPVRTCMPSVTSRSASRQDNKMRKKPTADLSSPTAVAKLNCASIRPVR